MVALKAAPTEPRRKTEAELRKRATALINMHQETLPVRLKIRDIMNGGQAGLKALLDKLPKNEHSVPAANLMLSASDRLAQKLGDLPDVRIDPPQNTDNEAPHKKAAKRERIVSFYDDFCRLEMHLPQAARWLPGYGFAIWVLNDGWTSEGHPYPLAELRDPIDCFPASWGADQQPTDVLFLRRVPRDTLQKTYPHADIGKPVRLPGGAIDLSTSVTSESSVGTASAGWEGARQIDALEVYEYYDDWGTYIALPGGQILDAIENPLKSGPQFVVAKRFAFDQLQGQFDQIIGLLATMARFNVLSKIAMEDAIMAPAIVTGRMEGPMRWGRFATNHVEGGDVQMLQRNMPYQLFQEIDRIERQLRLTAGYSVQDDGEPAMSFVTGRGLSELAQGADRQVNELQKSFRYALQDLDAKRFEWDERRWPNLRKPIEGTAKGEPFSENYTPRIDIKGNRRTRRAYGAMAGFDDHQKIVAGLQLLGARVISRQTMQENLSGLDNITRENDRIRAEQAEEALFNFMMGVAGGQPVDPRVPMTLIEFLPESKMKEALQHFWTPEGEEISPEEAAMMGAAQEPGLDLPAEAPDVATVLSILRGDGDVGGGAQMLSRLS